MACLFGHKWDGCKCTKCGKTRDEGHDWDGCKCTKCGKTRDEGHKWEGARCARYGATRLSGVLTDSEISDVVKCLGTMKTTLKKTFISTKKKKTENFHILGLLKCWRKMDLKRF